MSVRKLPNPWVIKKGVTTSFKMRFSNRASAVPVDITGYQFRTDLRYKANDADPIATLINGSGFTIVDADNGEVSIDFEKDTVDLIDVNLGNTNVDFPFVNVYMDIEYNDGDDWHPFLMGVVRVYEQFTRSNDV